MKSRSGTTTPGTERTRAHVIDPTRVSTAWVLGHERQRVLITSSGGGQSSAADHVLTRWSGDRVEDCEGWWIFVRDLDDGRVTSPTLQPVRRGGEAVSASAEPGLVTFTRRDAGLELVLEIAIHPELALELRRLTVRDLSGRPRRLDVTGVAEVVLHHRAADLAHPAFSKLFVQTEVDHPRGALLARRRPRSKEEIHPWLAATLVGAGALEWETDRAQFVGRGTPLAMPRAIARREPLSGTVGNVLDPVLALRRTFQLAAHGEARFGFLLASAPDRAVALERLSGWDDARITRTLADAVIATQTRALELGLDAAAATRAGALAGGILVRDPRLCVTSADATRTPADPARLAALGLSLAQPLVVAITGELDGREALDELVSTHRWWRVCGVEIQTVVIGDGSMAPTSAIPASSGLTMLAPGALDDDTRIALLANATLRVRGRLADPLAFRDSTPLAPPEPAPPTRGARLPDETLRGANGYGGFSSDGREYVIRMPIEDAGGPRRPPAPWVNVIAHEGFGVVVSESGSACTWSGNSREHRLTPWSNDPQRDPYGEAFYIRDDETGALTSPLPGPAPGAGEYVVRHGIGVSRWRHESDGLRLETEWFVTRRERVRITRIRVSNRGDRTRSLSVASYQRLVLGVLPEGAGDGIVSAEGPLSGVMTARRTGAGTPAAGTAFVAMLVPKDASPVSCTADREAFLGRLGSPARPAMLARGGALDVRVGAGLDPCLAQLTSLRLAPGATVAVVSLLGECPDEAGVKDVVTRLAAPGGVDAALAEWRGMWDDLTTRLTLSSPSEPLDLMLNGWLVYQTLSCRLWGRTAFYQSGGAWGFRDQLQDATALLLTTPALARAQLLLHAAHQFEEGDVLHWWHPPEGRGIRTHFADDRLWLPWLTATYVETTGDHGVLDERVRFLSAPALAAGVDEAYLTPVDSGQAGTLYEHGCRAIERSLGLGAHGLPLFGSGDWNDGMNRVGREGRGESVWMGFFLYTVIGDFLPLVVTRGDHERAARWSAHRERLSTALETSGWDGEWYRRAYYDDGTPLGTHTDDECRIDAVAQAWAVMSRAVAPARASQAMDSVERLLIRETDGVIRLLTPPFEHTPHDPGYIKGYVPGVRENGGQYTHAALWVVRALAELGRRERAVPLLEMLTPVAHAATPERIAGYRVEPYVVAADVYGAEPHIGRGGWTWYTGSSGWMLRVLVESILGLRLEAGRTLTICPCIPASWPGYTLVWRPSDDGTVLEIVVENGAGSGTVRVARLDGTPVPLTPAGARVPLPRDGRRHRVEIVLGEPETG